MIKDKIKILIKRLQKHFNESYDYKKDLSPVLDVLIATKLSQNTTDKCSYTAYKNLKSKFSSWEDVSKAPISKIKECIKICGLSNTKAKNIKEMLQSMVRKHKDLNFAFLKKYNDEEVYNELLQYKGIGVKTISCVLIFALGRDAFPVDTHVNRILNRLGIVKTNSPEKTFLEMNNKIPKGKKYELHTNLIKFGRNICKAKNPLCSICFLYDICEYELKAIYRERKITGNIRENNFIILENI